MKIHAYARDSRLRALCGYSSPYMMAVSVEEFGDLLAGKGTADDVKCCGDCALVHSKMVQPEPQQDSTEGFAEVGPEWAALVKRLRAAQDNGEGIVLTARDVEVLNRALKALAAYIFDFLKTRIGAAFKAAGLS
jgi:hypothetical protein